MKTYTFEKEFVARTVTGQIVIVPDQVADDQKAFDGKTFPAIRRDGSRCRATLRGKLYGLHTPGTGDMVVSC